MRRHLLGLGLGLALACLSAAGCQLVTDFEITPIAETTEALCTDGRDGDFDGLEDCQDWGCLGRVACCDIPEVLIDDAFDDGPATCDVAACEEISCAERACGPDPARWHAWPCPRPRVCGGQLHIDKTQCYAGGVLSTETAALGPGLVVATTVLGRPERLGHLEVALTLQDEEAFPGSLDPCGRLQEVNAVAAARLVWAEGGSQVVARFRAKELGRSPVIADPDAPHAIVIAIDRDRRVTYDLDGVRFATADVPVPTTEARARIALTGLTDAASFGSLRVEAGIRCHDPQSWVPRGAELERSVVLAGAAGSAFDADEVYHPETRQTDAGLEVFYTGCYWPGDAPACNEFGVAIGRATLGAGADGVLTRDPERNPWLVPADLTQGGVNGSDPEASIAIVGTRLRAGFVPHYVGVAKGFFGLGDALEPIGPAVPAADRGAWDEGEVCCATAVDGPDGVRRLWYAARVEGGPRIWRIGLATSTDGATFSRPTSEPVLVEGPTEAFDGGGASNPTVLYDDVRGIYRMWYEGRDFFGKVTIGYAVSTDGLVWSRFPGNPVLTPEQVGLVTIGGPSVERAADGRLLMLVHGTTLGTPRRRIFALVNDGRVSDAP